MTQLRRALIVARPSRLRDGLETLIAAAQQIDVVTVVDGGPPLSQVIADTQPALVILDTAIFGGECQFAVSTVKAVHADTKCIVLADSLNQLRRARKTSADAVLLKGFSGTRLYRVAEELLACSASYPNPSNDGRTAYQFSAGDIE